MRSEIETNQKHNLKTFSIKLILMQKQRHKPSLLIDQEICKYKTNESWKTCSCLAGSNSCKKLVNRRQVIIRLSGHLA